VGGALDAAGIPPTPRRLGRFRRTYVRILRRTIDRYPGRVHPGVRELVAALRGRALLGLQTGNWRPGAQAKLAHFGLWAPFAAGVGGFGCDADEREGLLPAALSRAMRHGWRGGRVLVLGDTPADVQCARRGVAAWRGPGVDLVTVAVRTGFAAPDALAACGPDLLFDDLAAAASAILDRT
jgi:phosphoglycolate phosphatase